MNKIFPILSVLLTLTMIQTSVAKCKDSFSSSKKQKSNHCLCNNKKQDRKVLKEKYANNINTMDWSSVLI